MFAHSTCSMDRFKVYLDVIAGRDRRICEANLETHPYADCHKPSRFYSHKEYSLPAFNLHETNLKISWRNI